MALFHQRPRSCPAVEKHADHGHASHRSRDRRGHRRGGARALGTAGFALALVITQGPSTALASAVGWLTSDDGRLQVRLGTYSDCSGRSPLQRDEAAVDTCIPDRAYIVGHNLGVFTPLLRMRVGDHITWTDPSARPRRLRIIAVRDWVAADGVPPVETGDVVVQFQTCITPDGSLDRILDAVEEAG
jgi:hypothetical protein